MMDPDPLSKNSLIYGTKRWNIYPFQTLSVECIFKDHHQDNTPIRLPSESKILVREGKFLPKGQKSQIVRVVRSTAMILFEFGMINLVAFNKDFLARHLRVCEIDWRS